MIGITRDVAQAIKMWSPAQVIPDPPVVPNREDPGSIDTLEVRAENREEADSGNPEGTGVLS